MFLGIQDPGIPVFACLQKSTPQNIISNRYMLYENHSKTCFLYNQTASKKLQLYLFIFILFKMPHWETELQPSAAFNNKMHVRTLWICIFLLNENKLWEFRYPPNINKLCNKRGKSRVNHRSALHFLFQAIDKH